MHSMPQLIQYQKDVLNLVGSAIFSLLPTPTVCILKHKHVCYDESSKKSLPRDLRYPPNIWQTRVVAWVCLSNLKNIQIVTLEESSANTVARF